MQPSTYKHTAGYKSLMVYIIYQALTEINHRNQQIASDAREFLLSEDCQAYCEVVGFDHNLIKEM